MKPHRALGKLMLLRALTIYGAVSLPHGFEGVVRVGRVALIELNKLSLLRIRQRLALKFFHAKLEPSIAIAILLLERRVKLPEFRLLQSSEVCSREPEYVTTLTVAIPVLANHRKNRQSEPV
jgi:hypothetical protein